MEIHQLELFPSLLPTILGKKKKKNQLDQLTETFADYINVQSVNIRSGVDQLVCKSYC